MRSYRLRSMLVLLGLVLVLYPACGDDDGGSSCPAGQTDCGGDCVNVSSDATHCGSCDNACSNTEACINGVCQFSCDVGEEDCGGVCVDTRSDPDFCGDCFTSCGSGEVCVGGLCETDCGDLAFSMTGQCQGCMERNCCTALGACRVGSECASAIECARGCLGDEDCEAGCLEEYPGGTVAAQALLDCRASNCPASSCDAGVCNTNGEFSGLGPINVDSYANCVNESCCDSFLPCFADADCADCIDTPTATACETNALWQDFQTCAAPNCPLQVCDTDQSFQSVVSNKCVGDNCCASFTACINDNDCADCAQGQGTDCENDTLFTTFTDCLDANCPTGICTAPIFYNSSFGDPLYECNQCAGDNCCADLVACVGDESQGALNLCINCLNDPESVECNDATVHDDAVSFNACIETNCPDCT